MIFADLTDILKEKRALWGGRLKLLLLKPSGDVAVTITRAQLDDLVSHLVGESAATGANSVCFAALVSGSEVLLTMTDNGWHRTELTVRIPVAPDVPLEASGTGA